MGPEVVRVLLVDDEPMVCAHLRTILGSGEGIEVVGTANDGAAGVEAVKQHRPDVVLMDLRMPGVDGITAIDRIRRAARPAGRRRAHHLRRRPARAAGAARGCGGFLVKSTPPEDLINLVRVAADGHTVLSPIATRRLMAGSAADQAVREQATALTVGLTERETDVLRGIGAGRSNAQIAAELYLSEATVKGYVSRLLVKLECTNRTQAGLLAHDAGLTPRP